ncbi:hypothetical protein GPECTOR_52g36 [Gonium pectorale]|uniref:Apple domain-containing protein n=1 Tax=Gonium pectorale TaxID=33097 RepID=A0A150G7V9_GONPE|nr:hypothetical protein GPECTOR_52g36 [Gonium pectorale]|eukprot:KXZ45635.1 hypothetical protein GPECTOR_52g36 [Gonium pectorale]
MTGLTLDSSSEFGGYWWSFIRLRTCSDGTQYGRLFPSAREPTGSAGYNFSCAGGFVAFSAWEAAPGEPRNPLTKVSFACADGGVASWTSPAMGAGAPGVSLTSAFGKCPDGGAIYRIAMKGNNSFIAAASVYCAPQPGEDWNPLDRCPVMPGYTLVPGYYASGSATNLTALGTGTTATGAMAACSSDSSCAAVLFGSGTISSYQTQAVSLVTLQAAVGTGGAPSEGCSGTYVRTATGPRQYYCVAGLSAPSATVLSTSAVQPHLCGRACDTSMGCVAYVTDPAGSGCRLLSDAFSASLGPLVVNVSAAGALCMPASESYWCAPQGWSIKGDILKGPWYLRNPEMCRAACDANSTCTHYHYRSADFTCTLLSNAWYGSSGANGPDSDVSRACVKTPQHASLGRSPGGSLPHAAACYPGVALSDPATTSPIVTLTAVPYSSTTCAAACASNSDCAHWSLMLSGECRLFSGSGAPVAGQASGYGPLQSVAVSCLATVGGRYHCLPTEQGVAYTQLYGFSGAGYSVSRGDCADACTANAACVSFLFRILSSGTVCVLHSTVFHGDRFSNVREASVIGGTYRTCLRTLSARQRFGNAADVPLPCPAPSGAIFYPNPTGIPSSFNTTVLKDLNETVSSAMTNECLGSSSCVAVQATGYSTTKVLDGSSSEFQKLLVLPGAGDATCAGTYVRSSPDPWYCLPDGHDIPGMNLSGYPTYKPSSEVCAEACLSDSSCSGYVYSADSGNCTARSLTFLSGPDGSTSAAADPQQRACVKTPMGAYGEVLSYRYFWSHACFAGTHLGGTALSSLASASVASCAKWCAAYGTACTHYQLTRAGGCEVFSGAFGGDANGEIAYGPSSAVAMACLRATVTGAALTFTAFGTATISSISAAEPATSLTAARSAIHTGTARTTTTHATASFSPFATVAHAYTTSNPFNTIIHATASSIPFATGEFAATSAIAIAAPAAAAFSSSAVVTTTVSSATVTTSAEPATAITTSAEPATAITTSAEPATAITTSAEPATAITTSAEPATAITTAAEPATATIP